MKPILFSSMVHFVKPIADYARGVKTLPLEFTEKHPFYKLLFQNDELAMLAGTLLELIPVTSDNITYQSKSLEKIHLNDLIEKIKDFMGKMVPDSQFSTAIPEVDLEKIQLWNFVCTIQDLGASKPWKYDYSGLIVDALHRVAFIPNIQLLTCKLSNNNEKIYLNLEWHGIFKNIEFLTISGEPNHSGTRPVTAKMPSCS